MHDQTEFQEIHLILFIVERHVIIQHTTCFLCSEEILRILNHLLRYCMLIMFNANSSLL